MSITIYIPRDNGDLKYIAEVDEVERPEMALDALLDEMPRVGRQSSTFIALNGTLEDGSMVTLTLDPDAPVEERPKRAISVSSNGSVAAPQKDEEPDEAEDEPEEKPAPRRRRPRKGTASNKRGTSRATTKGSTQGRRGTASKATASRGRKSSPFKSRPDED
jgi:hypothetical protein